MGVNTVLVGIVGRDSNGVTLRTLLRKRVGVEFVESLQRPTITKLRVLSQNQQIIRLDTEEVFGAKDGEPLPGVIEGLLSRVSVCILSDYAKGTLSQVALLIALCRSRGVPVLVDPKGSDFTRYRGATVLTPNLLEFEAVVGATSSVAEIGEKGRALLEALELEGLVVTMGERGMAVLGASGEALFLPAWARQVFDVSGAGDTVIGTLAACLGAGLSLQEAAGIANLAAGIVVGKIGVASVTPSELGLALHQRGQGARPLQRSEAALLAAEARSQGERVVMTNGCFDILHAGHVAYLQEAKLRGDRLMVAVNDDASVGRLKGPGRPINSLVDRMTVLAGLASVDWVVPFGEDTPELLVGEVLPDVLVKGGDYHPEDIAGYATVIANGGTVEVLAFHEGLSTTGIVKAAQQLAMK